VTQAEEEELVWDVTACVCACVCVCVYVCVGQAMSARFV